jgi:hypothetical protein
MSSPSALSVNQDEHVYKIAHRTEKSASPFRLTSRLLKYCGTNRFPNHSYYTNYYVYEEINMKQTIRNILFAGTAVLTLSLVPSIADARSGGHGGGGHGGGGHMGGAHMGGGGHMGGHFAGGHYGHGGRYASGYRRGYGYGYGGGYCGPIQIAAGLCGGYGY